jgi:hypothetical protein
VHVEILCKLRTLIVSIDNILFQLDLSLRQQSVLGGPKGRELRRLMRRHAPTAHQKTTVWTILSCGCHLKVFLNNYANGGGGAAERDYWRGEFGLQHVADYDFDV